MKIPEGLIWRKKIIRQLNNCPSDRIWTNGREWTYSEQVILELGILIVTARWSFQEWRSKVWNWSKINDRYFSFQERSTYGYTAVHEIFVVASSPNRMFTLWLWVLRNSSRKTIACTVNLNGWRPRRFLLKIHSFIKDGKYYVSHRQIKDWLMCH